MLAEYHRTTRVGASLAQVWEEMSTLDKLLGYAAEAYTYRVAPDGHRAAVRSAVDAGPLSWPVLVEVEVEDSVPPHRLRFLAEVSTMELTLDAALDLTAAGGAETVMRYSAVLVCEHWALRRLRSIVRGALEDHVDGLTDRIATAAARHAAARRNLAETADAEPGPDHAGHEPSDP